MSPGSAGDLVTLTQAEAVALGLELRDDCRWMAVAAACLGQPAPRTCP